MTDQLLDAVKAGDEGRVAALLNEQPELLGAEVMPAFADPA